MPARIATRYERITTVPESQLDPVIAAARRNLRFRQELRTNPPDGFDVPSRAAQNMPALRGELAPGGAYDVRHIGDNQPGSQTLWTSFRPGIPFISESGHDYSMLSDTLPLGTTFAQANAALQRFNAPTARAWRGEPGDPSSRREIVTTSGGIPAGVITVDRGEGWVRNTTVDGEHLLRGSVTRRLVRDDQGMFRILTEGVGHGGAFGDVRHAANAIGGPSIFSSMDEITLRYLQR